MTEHNSISYHRPNLEKQTFARTNRQTIEQRATLIAELLPNTTSIAELCCGDCSWQHRHYSDTLNIQHYRSLDLDPAIVARNQTAGIDCICANVMDRHVLHTFLAADVVFFGPPLSVDCDGHQLLSFHNVTPSFTDFTDLFLGELDYNGTLVCICPKTTTMGDAAQLYHPIQQRRNDVGLRLIHHTYATLTGSGEQTAPRLKYVELWFSSQLADRWELRESRSI